MSMTLQRFQLNAERRVTMTNFCHYRTPTCHPDRIMEEHDLIYMTEGEWEIRQEDECFTMKPGDVLILPAGKHHYGVKPCLTDTRTMYIHCTVAPGDGGADTEAPEDGNGVWLPPLIHCGHNPRIRRLFSDVACYGWLGASPTDAVAMSSLTRLLFCELTDLSVGTPAADRLIGQAVVLMRENPSRILSGAELAEKLGVSERTLRDRFTTVLGCTPHRYQIRKKLEWVREMLDEYPGLTLQEVAADCGFCDEFHLSRCFKAAFGLSPRDYRRR